VKHADETAFWTALRSKGKHPNVDGWEEAVSEVAISDKRAHYLAEKWSRRGLWDSGVTLRSGWFTDAGWALVELPEASPERANGRGE
jgi:hypothetical protein